jgi:glutamine synthetase
MKIIILEYIWIDKYLNLKSKTKVHYTNIDIINLSDVPIWNYDDFLSEDTNVEIILKPVKFVKDPFRRYIKSFLVLCETYDIDNNPILNNRPNANNLFNAKLKLEPWFDLEQEYFLIDDLSKKWPVIYDQDDWYCGIGKKQPIERFIVEEHLECCLYSGLNISSINSEVSAYQWKFQLGACIGIDAGDQLWLARYILSRICEKFGVIVSYKPKILQEINGSGCHINFSTIETRLISDDIGFQYNCIENLYDYIEKLSKVHKEYLNICNINYNENEIDFIDIFSFGVGTRNTSIRIPNKVIKDGFGYFEDRRPGANMEPYLITSYIFKTCCL